MDLSSDAGSTTMPFVGGIVGGNSSSSLPSSAVVSRAHSFGSSQGSNFNLDSTAVAAGEHKPQLGSGPTAALQLGSSAGEMNAPGAAMGTAATTASLSRHNSSSGGSGVGGGGSTTGIGISLPRPSSSPSSSAAAAAAATSTDAVSESAASAIPPASAAATRDASINFRDSTRCVIQSS